jgi:hypothetical protein
VRLHKETSDTYVSSDVPCPSDSIGSLAELIAMVTVVPLARSANVPLWVDHTVSINILHMHRTCVLRSPYLGPFHCGCVPLFKVHEYSYLSSPP